MVIGFETNYSVDESVGMVNVCAVVRVPTPDVLILSTIVLSVNTVEGTAGEYGIDYYFMITTIITILFFRRDGLRHDC